MNKKEKFPNNIFMENVKKKSYLEYISYFIFYSFIGCILETCFGLFTKGVIESRQSFLFGPFCVIYGIGAVLIIFFLSNFKDKPLRLFLFSCLIGTISEFLMSYFCEKIFHFKWWDYSGMKLNINGRTCLYFSVMWGVLGIILIRYVNPLLDKVFEFLKTNVKEEVLKISLALVLGFLIFDASVSYIGLKSFYSKIVRDFDFDLKTSEIRTGI